MHGMAFRAPKRRGSWGFVAFIKTVKKCFGPAYLNVCLINVCKVAEFGETCFDYNLIVSLWGSC